MKVILQKEIEKLGAPGDVVNVADGYGRNYLVPRGLAIQATKGAVRQAESLKRAHEERVSKARTEAEAVLELDRVLSLADEVLRFKVVLRQAA